MNDKKRTALEQKAERRYFSRVEAAENDVIAATELLNHKRKQAIAEFDKEMDRLACLYPWETGPQRTPK